MFTRIERFSEEADGFTFAFSAAPALEAEVTPWVEPQRFDPERFTPTRAENEKHTHSWVPFGGGAHLCIGYRFAEVQVKGIMHQLLLRHRWSVSEGYRMPVQQAPISKPLDGLPIHPEPA